MTEQVLARIEIPDFKEHIELSKARRAKYFIKAKADKLPKKYQAKEYSFNKQGILVDSVTKEKIIANSKSVGTPKLWKVNGQDLYNGVLNPFVRNKATSEIHQYIRPYLKGLEKIVLAEEEFIRIHLEIWDVPGAGNWDCSNKWPWIKWFEDTLTESKKLPDDSIIYIRDSGRIIFKEISDVKERKLVFVITKYKD